MPYAPNYYVVDPIGQLWLLGVQNPVGGDPGAYTLTPAPGATGVVSPLNLTDSATGAVYYFAAVLDYAINSAWLEAIPAPFGAVGVPYLPMVTPNGTYAGIGVANNYIVTLTVPQPLPPPCADPACQFTLGDAYTGLSRRLYDPTYQFWTQAELLLYLQEAFREWNALTAYWRGDFLFQPSQGVQWYDITAVANTLRPLTLTTTNLYTIIEYHLLEPPVGAGAWTGSAQFALADIQMAVSRRRNELLGATGCNLIRCVIDAVPGRITLPNDTLDVRRIAFLPAEGQPSPLFADDAWSWGAFEPDYTTLPPGVPSTFALNPQPLLTFDVDRSLNQPGYYELVTTKAPHDPALNVPDDWAWVIKWGALAELLNRESNAKDPLRAKYAETRYQQGMQLLAMAPALLGFRVNNVPAQVDSVRSADQYATTWESLEQGPPTTALAAGLNLIALAPPPDAGPYSLTATVVENAPVPVNPTDCLLLTEDVFEAILDEAQHIAAFKMGGAEFASTMPLHQRFMAMAALYSSRIAEMGEFSQALEMQSQQEEGINPRLTADTPQEAEA